MIERQLTKKYAFESMGLYERDYTDTSQISGTFIGFKKSAFLVKFVNEWLHYCVEFNIISPSDSSVEEFPNFIAHREDQSILSLLGKKYNLRTYSDPSQYGCLPEKYHRNNCVMQYHGREDYRPFILHHRTKDGNRKVLLNQWLCAALPGKIGLKLIK